MTDDFLVLFGFVLIGVGLWWIAGLMALGVVGCLGLAWLVSQA